MAPKNLKPAKGASKSAKGFQTPAKNQPKVKASLDLKVRAGGPSTPTK
jgi:hypothetical protein